MTFASTNHQTMEAGMTEFLDIPGSRIAYGICRTGPLVLLAHGLGEMRRAYRFLAPLLVAAAMLPFLTDHAEYKLTDWRQP
jgi:predicted dienelactone hydrolase